MVSAVRRVFVALVVEPSLSGVNSAKRKRPTRIPSSTNNRLLINIARLGRHTKNARAWCLQRGVVEEITMVPKVLGSSSLGAPAIQKRFDQNRVSPVAARVSHTRCKIDSIINFNTRCVDPEWQRLAFSSSKCRAIQTVRSPTSYCAPRQGTRSRHMLICMCIFPAFATKGCATAVSTTLDQAHWRRCIYTVTKPCNPES